ncbi:DUF550 domain-containing protein [Enterobacter asburiae]|uniref:DUF550 domain-containing protein n=1 Tax=Enterobacter asburiae TaxID=61645 RepID=UPI003BBD43AF
MITITRERLQRLIRAINSENYDEEEIVECVNPDEILELARIALASLDAEPIYQCEFCHHDGNGELQWHWEDVNKDFYHQYDSERRGNRRVLYDAPQLLTNAEHAGLQAYRKTASQPIGWTDEQELRSVDKDGCGYLFKANPVSPHADPRRVLMVYTAPPLSNFREKIRADHAQWSRATFGNVGPVGPLKHLSKEALEAAAEPNELSEWADMQFLLWDAQRRAGITDEQIFAAMVAKLEVNKARTWPEPKDGEPRYHLKED